MKLQDGIFQEFHTAQEIFAKIDECAIRDPILNLILGHLAKYIEEFFFYII